MVFKILYPKDHWTLKTGYFEDPTLLSNPSIGGSKILRVKRKPCSCDEIFVPRAASRFFCRHVSSERKGFGSGDCQPPHTVDGRNPAPVDR